MGSRWRSAWVGLSGSRRAFTDGLSDGRSIVGSGISASSPIGASWSHHMGAVDGDADRMEQIPRILRILGRHD